MEPSIPVVVVSRNRAGESTTHKVISNCVTCVPDAQYSAYRAHHSACGLLAHPDTLRTSVQVRSWLLQQFADVVLFEDNCIDVGRLYLLGEGASSLGKSQAHAIIQQTYNTCKQLKAHLFSYPHERDPRIYQARRPFCFGGPVSPGCVGHLKSDKLTYPDTVPPEGIGPWISGLNAYYHRFHYMDLRFYFKFRNQPSHQTQQRDLEKFLVTHFGRAATKTAKKRDRTSIEVKPPWSH